MIVLGTQSEQEMTPLCYEVGADAYVCVHTATTRNLIWTIARAIQRHQLIRENQHFQHAEQTRLQREHDEATRLIQEQWAAIEEAERHPPAAGEAPPGGSRWRIPLPQELIVHYRELLRTYVIMGSGNLSQELRQLAETLVAAGLTARQTMRLHLEVLEELVHGLGSRSTPTRHDPGRPAVAGTDDALVGRLSAAVSRADGSARSADSAGACGIESDPTGLS